MPLGVPLWDDQEERKRRSLYGMGLELDPPMTPRDMVPPPAKQHFIDIQNGPFSSRAEYRDGKAVDVFDPTTGARPALGAIPSVAEANPAEFGMLQRKLGMQQQTQARIDETGHPDVPTLRELASMLQPQTGFGMQPDYSRLIPAQQGLLGQADQRSLARQHLGVEQSKVDALSGKDTRASDRALETRHAILYEQIYDDLARQHPDWSADFLAEAAAAKSGEQINRIRGFRDRNVNPEVGPPAPGAKKSLIGMFGVDTASKLNSAKTPDEVAKTAAAASSLNPQTFAPADARTALLAALTQAAGNPQALASFADPVNFGELFRGMIGRHTEEDQRRAMVRDLLARQQGVPTPGIAPRDFSWGNVLPNARAAVGQAGANVLDWLRMLATQGGRGPDKF